MSKLFKFMSLFAFVSLFLLGCSDNQQSNFGIPNNEEEVEFNAICDEESEKITLYDEQNKKTVISGEDYAMFCNEQDKEKRLEGIAQIIADNLTDKFRNEEGKIEPSTALKYTNIIVKYIKISNLSIEKQNIHIEDANSCKENNKNRICINTIIEKEGVDEYINLMIVNDGFEANIRVKKELKGRSSYY